MNDPAREATPAVAAASMKVESSLASLLRKDDPAPPFALKSMDDAMLSKAEPYGDNDTKIDVGPAIEQVATITHAPEPVASIEAGPHSDGPPSQMEADAGPAAPTGTTALPARTSRRRAPGFAQSAPKISATPRSTRWQWAALSLLGVTLTLQILLADRDRLSADPQWRPWMERLCAVFACSLPPWHDPAAFTMLDRDVRPLPGVPGVLRARATFRNDAPWPQRWPTLRLTLKDADGRTLGARALKPEEYLHERRADDELAPGQSAQIAVHVREPSANVVAFSFDFR